MNDSAATRQDLQALEQRLSAHFTNVSKQLATLTEITNSGFDTMELRFDDVESRLSDLEARMSSIELRMITVESKLNVLQRGVSDMNERLDKVEGRLTALEADVIELYKLSKETRQMFASKLKTSVNHERRLRKLESFSETAAKRVGLKFS